MSNRPKSKPLAFISYAHEDEAVAFALRNWIAETLLDGIEFFIAADRASIPLGEDWPKQINEALRRCEAALLVITPASVDRKWIYFEAGAAFARGIPVIPVCCQGFKKRQLTPPLSFLQAVQLPGARPARELVGSLARLCGLRAPQKLPALRLSGTVRFPTPKQTHRLKPAASAGELLAAAAASSQRQDARKLLDVIRRTLRAVRGDGDGCLTLRALLEARLGEVRRRGEELRRERDSLVADAQNSAATASAGGGFALIGLSDALADNSRFMQTLEALLAALDKSAARGDTAESIVERMTALLETHLGLEATGVHSKKSKL